MYAVVVNLTVHTEARAEFLRRLGTHVSLSLAEGRCTRFDVGCDPDDQDGLLYYEVYPNEEAFLAHIGSERVARHIAETAGMINGDVKFQGWRMIQFT